MAVDTGGTNYESGTGAKHPESNSADTKGAISDSESLLSAIDLDEKMRIRRAEENAREQVRYLDGKFAGKATGSALIAVDQ